MFTSADQLREAVSAALSASAHDLCVDVANPTFMDSFGLGTLLLPDGGSPTLQARRFRSLISPARYWRSYRSQACFGYCLARTRHTSPLHSRCGNYGPAMRSGPAGPVPGSI